MGDERIDEWYKKFTLLQRVIELASVSDPHLILECIKDEQKFTIAERAFLAANIKVEFC